MRTKEIAEAAHISMSENARRFFGRRSLKIELFFGARIGISYISVNLRHAVACVNF